MSRLHFFIVYNLTDEDRESAEAALSQAIMQGRLQHNIAERLQLSEIATAHERVESGQLIGNVVLSTD